MGLPSAVLLAFALRPEVSSELTQYIFCKCIWDERKGFCGTGTSGNIVGNYGSRMQQMHDGHRSQFAMKT